MVLANSLPICSMKTGVVFDDEFMNMDEDEGEFQDCLGLYNLKTKNKYYYTSFYDGESISLMLRL